MTPCVFCLRRAAPRARPINALSAMINARRVRVTTSATIWRLLPSVTQYSVGRQRRIVCRRREMRAPYERCAYKGPRGKIKRALCMCACAEMMREMKACACKDTLCGAIRDYPPWRHAAVTFYRLSAPSSLRCRRRPIRCPRQRCAATDYCRW